MTSVPVCPTHGRPMAESQYGGFFCKGKNPDGTFCKQKVKPGEPVAHNPAAEPGYSAQVKPDYVNQIKPGGDQFVAGLNPTHRVALAAAALNFAGQIYVGQGADAQGAALALADATYSAWLKATS